MWVFRLKEKAPTQCWRWKLTCCLLKKGKEFLGCSSIKAKQKLILYKVWGNTESTNWQTLSSESVQGSLGLQLRILPWCAPVVSCLVVRSAVPKSNGRWLIGIPLKSVIVVTCLYVGTMGKEQSFFPFLDLELSWSIGTLVFCLYENSRDWICWVRHYVHSIFQLTSIEVYQFTLQPPVNNSVYSPTTQCVIMFLIFVNVMVEYSVFWKF